MTILIFFVVSPQILFRVKALSYKGDESIWSRVVSCDVTAGVENPAEETFRVSTEGGVLHVFSPESRVCDIYTADGRLVRLFDMTGGQEYQVGDLPKGIYIVCGVRVLI